MKKRLFVILLALALILAYAVPAYAVGPNLVTNGTFEAGNTGFSSDYTYVVENPAVKTELWDPWTYSVGTDPNLYHSLWASFADHTTSGTKMMIVNAADEANSGNVWQQTVNLSNQVQSYTLFAGQTWEIGEVLVKTDTAGKVCVKFVLTDEDAIAEGWRITEAHVAVALTCAEIPQKNGNPIPGQFPGKFTNASGVVETGWICVDYPWVGGQSLCIAAHAKIDLPEIGHWQYTTHEFCIVSGTSTGVVGGGSAVVTTANTWNNLKNLVNAIPDCPDAANYIWNAEFVTSSVADLGGLVDFRQSVNVVGTVKTATLKIAADNAFAYSFNGGAEVSENLAADWRTQVAAGNFDPPDNQGDLGSQAPVVILDASPTGWGKVYTYNVAGKLHTGANTFDVTALNADWNTTSPTVNPAMVVYKLCGTSETKQWIVDRPADSETGWGGGNDFSGKNWATCTSVVPPVNYEFSFWAANSAAGNQADLQVFINGTYVGHADLSKSSGLGNWTQYTFTWNATGASTANIRIVNVYNVYDGDDFAIDDICLRYI